ncbi:MAG: ImmA/IrrE family metallo-endopeptidase [Bryobacteraceae bacterium]
MEILAGTTAITKVEDRRASSVRSGIYVPLFPIAEWLVENWFFLWDEWREDAPPERHSLLAAREGFALPDVTFRSTESNIEVAWRRLEAPLSRLEFLSSGTRLLEKAVVREECARLVEAVIRRLDEVKDLPSSAQRLQYDWVAILEATQDEEQRLFCERAARLGVDPFAIDDSLASQIEGLENTLPVSLVDDFCDAIPASEFQHGVESIRSLLESLSSFDQKGRWDEFRQKVQVAGSGPPWQIGYELAAAVREGLGLNGAVEGDPMDRLRQALGHPEVIEWSTPRRIEAILGKADTWPVVGMSRGLKEHKRRFLLARALGDYFAAGHPLLITKGQSEHQQRNRAFAAEFLAPAASIRALITSRRLDEEDITELAERFEVSSYVIRHQIKNHELAEVAA